MPKETAQNLDTLVKIHGLDSHFLRVRLAPVMFHYYKDRLSPDQAKFLTCELLQISPAGFESGIRRDYIGELELIKRNQEILNMRCEGFSFAAIAKFAKLSRVQVWRILKDFEDKNQRIILESHMVPFQLTDG